MPSAPKVEAMGDNRVLVTGLGLGKYSAVSYKLVGRERVVETSFVPVALVESLGLAGSTVVVLLTRKAREETFPALKAELDKAGVSTLPVDVPVVRDERDAVEVLLRLQENVPPHSEVHIDITHSLRHLPLIALAALTYLTSLRDVRLGGIYYGAFEVEETPKPIIDLSAVFRLTEWYHAVRSALEAGDYNAFVTLFRSALADVRRSPSGAVGIEDGLVGNLSSSLKRLEKDLAAGLPLEAGLNARAFLDYLQKLDDLGEGRVSPVLRAAVLALRPFRDHLGGWACAETVKHKRELRLDRQELVRELVVSRWYIETNQFQKALIILREAVVNLTLLSLAGRKALPGEQWLHRQVRQKAERVLGTLEARAKAGLTPRSPEEDALIRAWQALSDRRNDLAHAGFRLKETTISPEKYCELLQQVYALLDYEKLLRLPAQHTLLVSALGRTPGALFTALRHVRPDELVLIASQETVGLLPEVLERAGLPGLPVRKLVLADGLRDFHAVPGLVKDLTDTLGRAGEVIACLTGGSTLLQYAVELVAHRARSLGATVRAIATVDQRLPEDQRSDPYHVGEVYPVPWPGWGAGTTGEGADDTDGGAEEV
ncbi:MAG: TIGR02221 family CRISPR-associated protein [Firmicutes bacterium]|nr:TIGR02221 family CRISPR-associated protein [Bacillota bacterium]